MLKILGYFMDSTVIDPIQCEVYKDIKCSHVDGPLCDMVHCSIRANYVYMKDTCVKAKEVLK